jgi:hypothetical protein
MAELVTVRAFATVIDAQVACAVLQSAGLGASLRDEHVVSMYWLFSNAVGGVKLQVPADQVDVAQDLLDPPAPVGEATAATVEQDACEQCGGTRAESVLWGWQPAALTWFLMGVPLFPIRRRRRCAGCGTSLAWHTPRRTGRHQHP